MIPGAVRSTTNLDILRMSRDACGFGMHVNPYRLQAALDHMTDPCLDIGCASGNYVAAYNHAGRHAAGIDVLAPPSVAPGAIGRVVIGSVESLPFADKCFGSATMFEVLEHVDEPRRALREVQRVVRDKLVLSVPNAERYPEHEPSGFSFHHYIDRSHKQFFTADSLRELLMGVGFDVQSIKGINPVKPEVLWLSQFPIPGKLRAVMLRLLLRAPLRRPRSLTLLCIARVTP